MGKLLPGLKGRIADDGEFLVRGPLVMRGYRKEPQNTAEAVDADGRPSGSTGADPADPDLIAEIASGAAAGNAKLSRVEQIKRFRVLQTIWEPGGDEVTLTQRRRRRRITEKYAAEIDCTRRSPASGSTNRRRTRPPNVVTCHYPENIHPAPSIGPANRLRSTWNRAAPRAPS